MKTDSKSKVVVAIAILTILVGSNVVAGQQSDEAAVALQRAIRAELVDGDLTAAIGMYEEIVSRYAAERAVVAQALLHLGDSYEKLGDAQALTAYGRVLSDYGDQPDAVAEARSRLASLQSGDEADRSPGIVTRQVWPDAAVGGQGSVSPDGRYLAFVDWGSLLGHNDLAVYDTETGRAKLLTDWGESEVQHEYVEDIAWSRDGARIAYTRWDGPGYNHKELRVLRADGSDDHILLADDERAGVIPRAWSRAGDFIVCLFPWVYPGVRIVTISTVDGTVQILKTLGDHRPTTLSLSPDDRYIVYDYPQGDDPPSNDETALRDVFILATDGSSEERLVSHASNDIRPFWTPDGGRVVFSSDRTGRPSLYAVEVRDGRPAGGPELVRPDVGSMGTLGFSRSGALYYSRGARITDIHVAELDLNGGATTLSEPSPLTDRWEGTNSLPSWSPDGRRVAFFSRRGYGQGSYVVVKSMDTGEERDFALPTPSGQQNRYTRQGSPTFGSPEWTADGRHLLLRGEYRLDLETGDLAPEAFGRDLVFRSTSTRYFATAVQEEALRAAEIRILPRDQAQQAIAGDLPLRPGEELMWVSSSGGVRKMLPGGEVEEIGPQGDVRRWALSPDGTQLAWAVSDRLLMMPVEGGAIQEIARLSRPSQAADQRAWIETLQWTPDGQGLLYRMDWDEGVDRRSEFWLVPAEGGTPQPLDLDRPEEMRRMLRFRFHPDGKRVAVWTQTGHNEIWLMEGFPWQDSGR